MDKRSGILEKTDLHLTFTRLCFCGVLFLVATFLHMADKKQTLENGLGSAAQNHTERPKEERLVMRGDLVEQALWLKKLPKHVISKCSRNPEARGSRSHDLR